WNRVATGSSGNVYVAGTFIDAMQVGSTTLVSAGTSASWARMTMFAAKYVKCTSSTLAVSATQTNPTCSNPCAGTATTVPTGGTSPYTYSWNTSPVQTTQTVTGLCAGTYSVLVTDAAAATAAVTVIITQPSLLTATAAATAASCGSNNGTAAASASGGTSPYTYVWSNNSTTQQISNLIAGNYTITVTDANGCTKTATVTITQTGGPVLITSTTPQTCTQGGTAAAAAAGGSTPYTYQWCNGQTASTATGLSAGSCTIIVTDASGCSTTSTVTITSIGNIPSVSATSTPASCGSNNGTAAASASGGTVPYTYLWSNNSTTQQISNLSASNYTVTVTDASGCSQTQTVNVSQTPGPTAAVTATVINISPGDSSQLTATGGGTYSWSPATGLSCTTCANPTVTPLWGAGGLTYCVFVTDGNGCKDSACITISVESPCGDLFVPNAFSPNNDLANDIECVMINPVCVKNLTFIIYDRWGEKVFETSDVKICWDGMYKGKLMNTSVFVYFLEATLTNGEKINRKGNISLIR
ncbi:MAG: T9SS type B sorting domain-containing protein, partial [Bacteroidetes bacterium]